MKPTFFKLLILFSILWFTFEQFSLPLKLKSLIQEKQEQIDHHEQSLHKRHNLKTWLVNGIQNRTKKAINNQQYSQTATNRSSSLRKHNLISSFKSWNIDIANRTRYSQYTANNRSSRLMHNIRYIKKHFYDNLLYQQFRHNLRHNLNKKTPTHLSLQSYKLTANFYSFSLPMMIGGYQYDMSIDSGSSDIFIKGEKSQGKPKQRYHCGDICIKKNEKYTIGYLDGELRTYQAELEVKLGSHTFNQSILVAYDVDNNFKQNQGLVGLSFPNLASNPNPTFIQTLINNNIINHYAFGVNLNFQSQQRSFITFGTYDRQFFQGQLSYFPLTSELFYYVDSKGVSIGQNSNVLNIKTAIFDTGNTCISIPAKYENDILKKFNTGTGNTANTCYFSVQSHAEMFSVLRCKVGDFDALPKLNIHLGNKTFPIQKQYYLQACDRRPIDQTNNNTKSFWYCDTYIQSVRGMKQLFLGDGFFNRYYTYFDLENKQIGIAKNKEVIKIDKIKQNKLDNNDSDWEEILTKLNPRQSLNSIRKQIKQNKKGKNKKKTHK